MTVTLGALIPLIVLIVGIVLIVRAGSVKWLWGILLILAGILIGSSPFGHTVLGWLHDLNVTFGLDKIHL